MNIRSMAMAGLFFLLAPAVLTAAPAEEELQALREQIAVLSARLDALERRGAETNPAVAPETSAAAAAEPGSAARAAGGMTTSQPVAVESHAVSQAPGLTHGLRWAADLRYRYEELTVEGGGDRKRNRFRARAQVEAGLLEGLTMGLGLASGSEDPVSTNQTLGSAGSRKDVNIDLAWFEWDALPGTRLRGGKFRNPLLRPGGSELLWDSDWSPEGVGFKFEHAGLFLNGLANWTESDSSKPQREFSWGLQAGYRLPLGERFQLTGGLGLVAIDAAGKPSVFEDGEFFGNSFDPVSGTYVYDYDLLEAFAEISADLAGRPLGAFGHYVSNSDPEDENEGYRFGLSYGGLAHAGTWELSWYYQHLEADGVLGLLTHSDFARGGSGNKGSAISAAYAFHERVDFRMAYFLNETMPVDGEPEDADRLQLDLNFRYP